MIENQSLLRILCSGTVAFIAYAHFPVAVQAQPPVRPMKVAVEVTGEFRENGSCQVFADGVAVFHAADSAQTKYVRGATFNIAPAGFDAHEVWCGPRSSEQPMPPLDHTERIFVIMLYAPTGRLAQPRTYQIRTGLPTPGAAPYRAGAALFGMSPQMLNDTMPLRIGLLYLSGSRGTVVIARVEADRVVGKFVIHAQRALTM